MQNTLSDDELFQMAVVEMRKAQKTYAKTRRTTHLVEMKKHEDIVDQWLYKFSVNVFSHQ